MKKEMKDKWVAALRSGKYEQATDYLFDGEGYCCLGVLAKECGEEFGFTIHGQSTYTLQFDDYDYEYSDGEDFTPEILQRIGMSRETQIRLIELNDETEVICDECEECFTYECHCHNYRHANNFNDIADYIEKNLEVT